MRKTIAMGMVLLLFATFFVLSPSCAATKPATVTISYSEFIVDNTGIGSFSATGGISGSGTIEETFKMNGNGKTVHSEVVLTGSSGTITLQYHAILTPIDGSNYEITGRFVIMGGTGVYTKLHGAGSIDADLIGSSISGDYIGIVL